MTRGRAKENHMRNIQTASIVLAALLILPVKGLASPASRTHEVTGVVTFMDATTLAIRQRPYGRNMRFALNPSTEREGPVRVGSTVDVRYRTEADRRVATVVTRERAKAWPSTSGSHQ